MIVGDVNQPGAAAFTAAPLPCDPVALPPLPIYCGRFEDCPGIADVDFLTDSDNCGACGRACDSGTCQDGECVGVMFTSSISAIPGTPYVSPPLPISLFASVEGADQICSELALAAGFGNPYRAWLASAGPPERSPASRIIDRAYVTTGGAILVDSLAELASTGPRVAPQLDENAALLTPSTFPPFVWTGDNGTGSVAPGDTCDDWTNQSSLGFAGDYTMAGAVWATALSIPCDGALPARLYCFEDQSIPSRVTTSAP
jgi:hypothetical protein